MKVLAKLMLFMSIIFFMKCSDEFFVIHPAIFPDDYSDGLRQLQLEMPLISERGAVQNNGTFLHY